MELIDSALMEGRVVLPPVVVAELMSAQLTQKQEKELVAFLDDLPLCEVSMQHWIATGKTRALLAKKGLNVSTPDCHVAQCALDVNGFVISEDKIFQKMAKYLPFRLVS